MYGLKQQPVCVFKDERLCSMMHGARMLCTFGFSALPDVKMLRTYRNGWDTISSLLMARDLDQKILTC